MENNRRNEERNRRTQEIKTTNSKYARDYFLAVFVSPLSFLLYIMDECLLASDKALKV